jgi:hypothetical protein
MSLAKRLQREIKSSPGKAGGLAVLLLVAGYFWAPLIMQFFGNDTAAPASAPAASPAVAGPAVAAPTSVQVAGATSAEAPAYDWRRVAADLDADSRMASIAEPSREHDPFATRASATSAVAEVRKVEPVARDLTPDEAGLVLSSTLVSARRKIAEINDKSYRVGDRVRALGDDYDVAFRVVDVSPRRVLLERDGKRFELKIRHPLLDAVVERTSDESEYTEDP